MDAIPLSREQRLWLAGTLTLAAGLRFFGIAGLSLSHMDEGGYMGSAMTVATEGPFEFPFSQALQSPPLLPWLIGGMIWLLQAQWPILGVLLAASFGTGSVAFLFLLARRWGGNQFGLCAATLLAASDFHVAYSRMVLTDVPVTFWFLLTMYCVTRLWEQSGAGLTETQPRSKPAAKRAQRPPISHAAKSWLLVIGWGIAAGLAAGAGWNTKYNGWLVLAIAATAAGLWAVCERLAKSPASPESSTSVTTKTRIEMLFCGLLIATLIAAASYAPWYLYVERKFPGGYAAVSANHRGYFSSPAFWPAHAQSLIASLAALRHYGWLVTIGLVVGLAVRFVGRWNGATGFSLLKLLPAGVCILALATIVVIQGGDAALILLGAAGIVPALLSKSWPRLIAAVWCGTFVVLTPLYHPYPRLMLPALPACIALTLWLLEDAWPGLICGWQAAAPSAGENSRFRRTTAGASLALGAAISLVWLAGPHPFGLAFPTRGVWSRWSTHESYRAAGKAILEHTDADAIIICQTQLALVSYCPRTPIFAEDHSYQTLFEGFPKERSCFLAVDFGWIYQHRDSEALHGIVDDAENLTPLAVIPNDLNIVTLLDFLTPAEAAAKLAEDYPPNQLGPHRLPVPPSLSAPYQDVIVLYRVKWPR